MNDAFADRAQAGRLLARALAELELRDPVVLALPRGGVPVAVEVALAPHAPLDLLVVRKIGAPGNPELAVGAIAEGAAAAVVDDETLAATGTSQAYVDRQARAQLQEIARRRALYQQDRPPLAVEGRTAIVVDDGLATGSTARAAVRALRARKPARIVLAIPVAPSEAVAALRPEVDDLVCLAIPEFFGAVGVHYADFRQVEDDEVVAALTQAAGASAIRRRRRPAPFPKGDPMQAATDLPRRVKAALQAAGDILAGHSPPTVRLADGSLVLEGEVKSVKAKRSAVRVASELAGAEGVAVDDRLLIECTAPRPDGDMLDALGEALLASPEFRNVSLRRHHRGALEVVRSSRAPDAVGELEFAVADGLVVLTGTVPSLSHRRLAEVLAWWIGGCRHVTNRLRVDPAERDRDDELADAVALVLEVDPTLPDSQPIGVDAEQGVVKLTGSLLTPAQRDRAEEDAWCVEGVRDVRNAIGIRR